MAGIFRISEPAVLALHAMVYIAKQEGRPVPAREVAEVYSASEHHLAKVLRQLDRARLAKVTRGPRGGFRLGRAPSKITLLQIYEAVEGKYKVVKCFADKAKCPWNECILGGNIERITMELKEYLAKTTLAHLKKIK